MAQTDWLVYLVLDLWLWKVNKALVKPKSVFLSSGWFFVSFWWGHWPLLLVSKKAKHDIKKKSNEFESNKVKNTK